MRDPLGDGINDVVILEQGAETVAMVGHIPHALPESQEYDLPGMILRESLMVSRSQTEDHDMCIRILRT